MDKKIEKLLVTHASVNKDEECCGFVVLDNIKQLIIIPCENIYSFPKTGFKICPHEFLRIKKKYEIVCLYHSHPASSCRFSKKDLDQAEELCLPLCVYSLQDKSFNIHFPESYSTKSFIGRDYVHHFQNCWKLVYDYYNVNKNAFDKVLIVGKKSGASWVSERAVTAQALFNDSQEIQSEFDKIKILDIADQDPFGFI